MRRGWALAFALPLASCVKTTKVTLLELTCGAQRLRFEETMEENTSATTRQAWLLRASGPGWEKVDQALAVRGFGPETFSRLLPPDVAFHAIPFDAGRPQGNDRPGWMVFIDPAHVSRPDYDGLAACLAANALAIDRAVNHYPQITGTLYTAHDDGFWRCGGRTLGARWECADRQGYIKTVMNETEGQLLLCRPRSAPSPGQTAPPVIEGLSERRLTMGVLSTDQTAVFLREPTSYERESVLSGEDPKRYYATCRDASGKGLFDVLKPLPHPAPPRR
jgi:hypothetical protein